MIKRIKLWLFPHVITGVFLVAYTVFLEKTNCKTLINLLEQGGKNVFCVLKFVENIIFSYLICSVFFKTYAVNYDLI